MATNVANMAASALVPRSHVPTLHDRAALLRDKARVSITLATDAGLRNISSDLPRAVVVHYSTFGAQQLGATSANVSIPPPTGLVSILHIGPGLAAPGAVKWVVEWMVKACHHKGKNEYRLFAEKKFGFAQNVLVYQALLLFGITAPADHFVAHLNKHISTKQLTAEEVATVWHTLPRESKILKNMLFALVDKKHDHNLDHESAIVAYVATQPELNGLLSEVREMRNKSFEHQKALEEKWALREQQKKIALKRQEHNKKEAAKAAKRHAEWREPTKHQGGAYEKALAPAPASSSPPQVLNGAAMCWIAFPRNKACVASGSFSTSDVRSWSNPRPKNSARVAFPKGAFTKPPTVLVALNSLDMAGNSDLRIKASVDEVTSEGFRWHLDTWDDSTLYAAEASWIALGFA
ncbi:hypothetical protein B0A49_08020 [Cryomyces minteri]|uniref:H-type lectin domain-containing protein n=1 Tax=Cryomyces minteri TaxID=331657 RepID=A0A4U0WZG3_9PEZI|nr:hypothetical protein B0A49_08020 [Cryomyces minteri]